MKKHKKFNLDKVFVLALMMILLSSMNIALGSPNNVPVCGKETSGHVRCLSYVISDDQGKAKAMITPSIGYGPINLLSAYNLGTGRASTNKIIAIVDAYDQPNIYSDLTTYSNQFGIPSLNQCTVSSNTSSCFQKVDQRGGTNYPVYDPGWGLEISLDVEVAHGICQNCNILLVEADSNSYADIMQAFDTAVAMGADVISNSYGSVEFSGETSLDSHFNLPGKAITFSSGDGGYGSTYPAASPYVTAVGGTTLQTNPRRETVWNGAGSGCSIYEPKPSFQKDTGCGSKRTIADVSAVADPNTGAIIYDSPLGGWFQVGGTSLSAPIIAGVYALGKGFSGHGNAVPYTNVNYGVNLFDITSGNNGACGGSYLCTGVSGYDGPTGLGAPIGTGAFEISQTTTGLTLSTPNGGENWTTGSAHTISWSYTGNAGSTVEIDLYKSGSLNKVLATGISIGSGGTGSYNWNIDPATIAGNDYQIKVITDLGTTDMSDASFTISTTPSSIRITSPRGGENWQVSSSRTISWSYTGNPGSRAKIDLLRGGSLVRNIVSDISIGSAGRGSYRWRIGQFPNANNYQIRITTNTGYTSTSNNFRIRR